VNDEFTVSVVLARCLQRTSTATVGCSIWTGAVRPDITVAARMDYENTQPLDYYLLPALDLSGEKLSLVEDNGLLLDCYRFDDLDYLISRAPESGAQGMCS